MLAVIYLMNIIANLLVSTGVCGFVIAQPIGDPVKQNSK
jgi:hypothetical protein